MSGTSAPLPKDGDKNSDEASADADSGDLYPPLRQLPRLAVPYANLYRRVRVEETIYELLTQQYEVARIQEAQGCAGGQHNRCAGNPGEEVLPPRLLVALILTVLASGVSAAWLLFLHRWQLVSSSDPRKMLARRIGGSIGDTLQQLRNPHERSALMFTRLRIRDCHGSLRQSPSQKFLRSPGCCPVRSASTSHFALPLCWSPVRLFLQDAQTGVAAGLILQLPSARRRRLFLAGARFVQSQVDAARSRCGGVLAFLAFSGVSLLWSSTLRLWPQPRRSGVRWPRTSRP